MVTRKRIDRYCLSGRTFGGKIADGDTVQTYEYSVFGEPAASDPNHPNPYLFTARRFDAETGLYHYRARAYNPYIGRFLQTDPASQGMNAYTYCANSPVGRVDPSGLAHYNVLYYVDPDRPQNPKWWLLTGEWNIAGIHHQFGIHSGMYKIFSRTFFPPDGAGNSITVYYAKSHSSAGFASTSYKSGTGVPIDGLTGITRYLGMMQDLIADACDWNATDPSTLLARNWTDMAVLEMLRYFGAGAREGAIRGAAAELDGVIPFSDPFTYVYADASGRVAVVYLGSRFAGSIVRDAVAGAVTAGFWSYVGQAEAPGYAGMSLVKQALANHAMQNTLMTNLIEAELGAAAAAAYGAADSLWVGVQIYDYGQHLGGLLGSPAGN